MADEKDRLGDRLKERERAQEDNYFAQQEKVAIEKLRQATTGGAVAAVCPRCGAGLEQVDEVGVKIDRCPAGHGMWLDTGELELIAQREKDSWLGRLLPSFGKFAK